MHDLVQPGERLVERQPFHDFVDETVQRFQTRVVRRPDLDDAHPGDRLAVVAHDRDGDGRERDVDLARGEPVRRGDPQHGGGDPGRRRTGRKQGLADAHGEVENVVRDEVVDLGVAVARGDDGRRCAAAQDLQRTLGPTGEDASPSSGYEVVVHVRKDYVASRGVYRPPW
ncbi:MAG: hypothetical protein GEV07_26170 [Streptosporangiales bacterium]|nr:hypothetical protein [Streptosporangiales bacterium]